MMSALSQLAPQLFLLLFLSPVAAFGIAAVLYVRHCDRVERARRVAGFTYAMAVIGCGVVPDWNCATLTAVIYVELVGSRSKRHKLPRRSPP